MSRFERGYRSNTAEVVALSSTGSPSRISTLSGEPGLVSPVRAAARMAFLSIEAGVAPSNVTGFG